MLDTICCNTWNHSSDCQCHVQLRRQRIVKICAGCGIEFEVLPSETYRRFHDLACRRTNFVHPHRGKTYEQIYGNERGFELRQKRGDPYGYGNSGPWYKWRDAVYARDNHTCQKCGMSDVRLHAHHIVAWEVSVELRFEVSNGLTLCIPCHGQVHFKPRGQKEA